MVGALVGDIEKKEIQNRFSKYSPRISLPLPTHSRIY